MAANPLRHLFPVGPLPGKTVTPAPAQGAPGGRFVPPTVKADFDWAKRPLLSSDGRNLPVLAAPKAAFFDFAWSPAGTYFDPDFLAPGWNDLDQDPGSGVTSPASSIWLPSGWFGRKGAALRRPRSAVVMLYDPASGSSSQGAPLAALKAQVAIRASAYDAAGISIAVMNQVIAFSQYPVGSAFPADFADSVDLYSSGQAPSDPAVTFNDYYRAVADDWVGGEALYVVNGVDESYAVRTYTGGSTYAGALDQSFLIAKEKAVWAEMQARHAKAGLRIGLISLDDGSSGDLTDAHAEALAQALAMAASLTDAQASDVGPLSTPSNLATWAASIPSMIDSYLLP